MVSFSYAPHLALGCVQCETRPKQKLYGIYYDPYTGHLKQSGISIECYMATCMSYIYFLPMWSFPLNDFSLAMMFHMILKSQ